MKDITPNKLKAIRFYTRELNHARLWMTCEEDTLGPAFWAGYMSRLIEEMEIEFCIPNEEDETDT